MFVFRNRFVLTILMLLFRLFPPNNSLQGKAVDLNEWTNLKSAASSLAATVNRVSFEFDEEAKSCSRNDEGNGFPSDK